MMRMGGTGFLTSKLQAPPEVFAITEATIGRQMTLDERRVLQVMFETTVGAYDIVASSPNAVQVRKWLRKFAKTGQIPTQVVGPEEHFAQRVRAAMAKNEVYDADALAAVFATPMAGEADLLKAIDLVAARLRKQGTALNDAPASAMKAAAAAAAESVSADMKSGRPRNESDFGLLWGWADLAEHMGLRPTASFKPSQRRHISPFVRWLAKLAAHMPKRAGKPFVRNLGERAEEALQIWRDKHINSHLFD